MNNIRVEDIVKARRKIIENEFSSLNDMQRMAALTVKGPLLLLAGAGSGKTTVLVNRVANILRWGEAAESDRVFGEYSDEEVSEILSAAENNTPLSDELADRLSVSKVSPWRILAITFTNKAANELKERICRRVGTVGNDIWASTFHACCTRILRRYGEYLGYTSHFTIYDTDDQKRLIKDCIKALNIDEKMIPVKSAAAEISNAKDSMTDTEAYKANAGVDSRLISISKIYTLYQNRLLKADAMDFDDIIFNTVKLFKKYPDVLEKYQEQFRYIMVDEYQDTNKIQYELVHMLAGKYKNICVVGDDDQSIYKFRGATVRNILYFEDDYDNARAIKLEQNYRSTKNILTAANSVIKNNEQRKDKALWTQNEVGEKIVCYKALDERDEGSFIAEKIKECVKNGGRYSDCAVLYRMNSQSQNIERVLVRESVPYKIIGGHRFYERREIKDMMAYLSVISNPSDNIRLKRILNVPKRGIGEKTISSLEEISGTLGQSMFETMRQADEFEALVKSSAKLNEFCDMIEEMAEMLEDMPVSDMYEKLVEKLDYEAFILKASDHGEAAVDNVHELTSSIVHYEEENEEPTLQGFLEETALMTDVDSYDESDDKAVLMTLHSAKGLEFENVFIPGMEENVFPGYQSTLSEEDMQEERRLAYVGITRAKKKLYLISADSRLVYGRTNRNRESRFIQEISDDIKEYKRKKIEVDPNFVMPTPKAARRADIAMSRTITSAGAKKSDAVYTTGMRVKHKAFGEGMIISAKPMASDYMLEIAFDTVGTKKLMAGFAKLTVIE